MRPLQVGLDEREKECKIRNVRHPLEGSQRVYFAGVAQLVEQLTCNQQVVRSSRIAGSS